jgi:hypothetical protein
MSNPFRQPQPQPKEAVLYDDLQSARSAILSGSARKRDASSKAMSVYTAEGGIGDGLGDLDAIPLRIITPSKDLPLPPVPAMISKVRRGDKSIQNGQEKGYTIPEQPKPMPKLPSDNTTAPGSLYNSIKNALATISSPAEATGISNQNGADYNYGNVHTRPDAVVGDTIQFSIGELPQFL